MVQHRAILRADPFSATRAGAIRQPTDWLSEIGLYGLWALGRLPAIALAAAGMATAGMVLIMRATKGPVLVRIGVAALAAAASSVFWAARPQMVTFLFTAVVVLACVRLFEASQAPAGSADRCCWLWWLVPLFALWSNLHLGWFYGLLVLAAVLTGELIERRLGRPTLAVGAARTLAAVVAASLLAVMVNPVGPRIWSVIATQVSVGRAYIQENQPPKVDQAMSAPFFLLLAVVLILAVLQRRNLRVPDVLLLVGTAAAALMSVRTVPLFATVAAPIACRLLDRQLGARAARRPAGGTELRELPARQTGALNLVMIVVLALLVAAQTATKLGRNNVAAREAHEAPVAATRWIAENQPPREMFNTFDWGGYLMWKLPEYPVWIDGRADLYTEPLKTYSDLLRGRGWSSVFTRDHINVAVVPTGGGLARAIAADAHWLVGFQDSNATVLVRR